MNMKNKKSVKVIALNKKARHDYYIDETYEAGISLLGTEVKSLRESRGNLKESYARFIKDEIFLVNAHISPYSHTAYGNHDPRRPRKLLLHKREIKRLSGKIKERGLTLVPLRLYFKNGIAKLELGLGRGKKEYDKRQEIKRRDMARDAAQDLKGKNVKYRS
jgi:SsrA-binding protein